MDANVGLGYEYGVEFEWLFGILVGIVMLASRSSEGANWRVTSYMYLI